MSAHQGEGELHLGVAPEVASPADNRRSFQQIAGAVRGPPARLARLLGPLELGSLCPELLTCSAQQSECIANLHWPTSPSAGLLCAKPIRHGRIRAVLDEWISCHHSPQARSLSGPVRRNSDITIVMTSSTVSPAIIPAKRSTPGVGEGGGP